MNSFGSNGAQAPVGILGASTDVAVRRSRNRRRMRHMLAALLATSCLGGGVAHATDAVWTGATDGEWTDATNWSSDPLTPDGIATFTNVAGTTSIFNDNGFVIVNTMNFTGTALAYNFTANNFFALLGTGIQNGSGNTQTFTVNDTLLFANASTITGAVIITNAGFTQFQNTSSTGSATIVNNDIFQFFDSATVGTGAVTNNVEMDFFDSAKAGSATITNSGSGTLTFNINASAQTATILNNGGTVEFGGSATAANSHITNTGGALNFRDSSTAGAATVTTDSGTTSFYDSASGGTATFVFTAGGTLDISNLTVASTTVGSIAAAFGDGIIDLGANSLHVGGNNTSTTFGGIIQDAALGGSIYKEGIGTLTLTFANTYTGGTTIAAGRIAISADNNLGDVSGALTLQTGGTLQFNAAVNSTRNVVLGTGGGVIDSNGNSETWSGTFTGTGGLTKAGAGTLTLSGAGSYSGATAVNVGTLQGGAANAFSATSAYTVAAGATLALNNFNQTIGSLAGAGAVTLGSATLTEGGDNSSTTFSGGITGTGGLTKAGTGTTTLTGTNGYSGTTTISAGVLQVGNGGAAGTLGTGPVVDNATLTFNRSDNTVVGNAISGTGAVIKTGAGTLTLTGAGTYTGTTSVNTGTLQGGAANVFSASSAYTVAAGATLALNNFAQTIGSLAGAGAVTLGSATLTEGGDNSSTTFSGGISGTGGFIKTGTGTTTLSGTTTYSGTTAVTSGTLQGGAANSFDATSAYTVAAGATLALNSFNQTIGSLAGAGAVTLGSATLTEGGDNSSTTFSGGITGTGGLTKAGTGTFTLSGTTTYTGPTAVNAGTLQGGSANAFDAASAYTVAAGATLALNSFNQTIGSLAGAGNVTLGSATLTTGGDNSSTAFSGGISGTGGLVKSGTGTFTLSGTTTYAGTTAVNAGTLQAGAANAFDASSAYTIAAGATLALNNFNQTIGSLAGAGAVTLGSATLTTGGDNSSTTFSGGISGTGGLTKVGTGNFTLSGVSSYTGSTLISAGILSVNGTLTSVVTIGAGGTLKGTGTVGGVVVGGTVAPGNSIGTLNVAGNVSFAAGSIYQVEANAAGQADRISATGTGTLAGGTVQVLAAPGTYASSTTYVILSATGGVAGTFSAVTSNIIGLIPTLTYKPAEVDLTLSVVNLPAASQTPNQLAAATAIQAGGLGTALFNALGPLDAAGQRAALDQLSGEIHASVRSSMLASGETVRETVLDRLRDTADDSKGGGLWLRGFGGWSTIDSDSNAAALDSDFTGVMIGADAVLGGKLRLGVDGGYTHTGAKVLARNSTLSEHDAHFGAYAGLSLGSVSLRTAVQSAWGTARTIRNVAFTGFADTDTAKQDTRTMQAVFEAGYHSTMGSVNLEPFANVGWISANTGSFAETGGAAALSGARKESDETFTSLGLRADTSFATSGGIEFVPSASVAWQHAFDGLTPARVLTFQSIAQSFTVLGVPLDADEAVVSAGLEIHVSPSATLSIGYQGSLAQASQTNGVRAGFDWKF